MPLLPLGSSNSKNPNTGSATASELKGDPDPLSEFDEYGTELHREARVWKVYVKETDKYDGDLVKGWNDSADVILVFAALFSAISSAFLIESSKALQQDPLIVISQTLFLIANGTQPPGSMSPPNSDSTDFNPSRTAVWVNTLWYSSLSLSLATSFIAILAKDWCHSFMKDRTGHPFDQTCRRQKKWDMIMRWKMPELLAFLPSLIHLALLLFAIGLCITLWDTHITVAIPVICVSGVAFGFYVSSSVAASVLDSFPYPTIFSRMFRTKTRQLVWRLLCELPFVFAMVLNCIAMPLFVALFSLAFLVENIGLPGDGLGEHIRSHDQRSRPRIMPTLRVIISVPRGVYKGYFWIGNILGEVIFRKLPRLLKERTPTISRGLSNIFKEITLKSRLSEREMTHGLNDETVQALSWLITYCEVPESVNAALQSIAGATNRISRLPLLECKAPLQILRRLASSNLYRDRDTKSEAVVSLYLRALSFLGASSNSVSNNGRKAGSDLEASIWDLQMETERKLAALIENGGFDPTQNDLEALRIGSTVASTSQKVLRNELQHADIRRVVDSIIELLQSHLDGSENLHETSLLSLIHAATLILLATPTSVARGHSDSKTLVAPLMSSGNFPALSGEGDFSDTSTLLRLLVQLLCTCRDSKLVAEPAATCVFLYAMCRERVKASQPYGLTWSEEVACGLAEGYATRGVNLEWVRNMEPEGTSRSPRTFDLTDYISRLGSKFTSEYQATHPVAHQIVEAQPGDEVSSGVQEDIVGSGFYALGAIYSLGPTMTPSPPLYVSVVETMCRTPPSSPLFACGAQILFKCPFPTLSEELATALEQRDLVPLLETTSHSDNELKQHFARGQLWLLLSLYIYAGDTASGRDKLKVQLDKCRRNGDESEEDRHRELANHLYWQFKPRNIIARELGVWAWRLEECATQIVGVSNVDYIHNALRDVPPELRGLSSFTAWPRRASNLSTNESRPVEQVTNEARERADVTNVTTEGEGVTGRDGHLKGAGLVADTGEAETRREDARRASSSQDLEAATQGPPAGDGKSLAEVNSQEEVGRVRGEGRSGDEAVGDEQRVADADQATEATDGPRSESEEAESINVGNGRGNEGDVVIPMDRLENRSDGPTSSV